MSTPNKETTLAALQKVRQAYFDGIIDPPQMSDDDSCLYVKGKYRCGVGALFNKEQLNDIEVRRLNSMDINEVAASIGLKNIEYVTGMALQDLVRLQEIHDNAAFTGSRFLHGLDEMIESVKQR